jgi:ABC-type transport system involved in cytochrome c biogenesis permease subunit
LYLLAGLLSVCAWIGWTRDLNRAAFWLLTFTLAIHSFALVSRMIISGRPPVTNLYSSAVFIGWGAVIISLVLELVFRIGLGNVLGSVFGFITLMVAYGLSLSEDTFQVLQAVLDTQFWLATHVVCITIGYATTFVAGGLGIAYIMAGIISRTLDSDMRKMIARMLYGMVCFSIFFSFFGTVLGGLWADDSWGRFWGWDPKENGALLIVIWNALVLHARWGGLVRERGIAILAVAGNIVTIWSWFLVNQLGIGLHSYGFNEGVLTYSAIAVVLHLAVIGFGCLPTRYWSSYREHPSGV